MGLRVKKKHTHKKSEEPRLKAVCEKELVALKDAGDSSDILLVLMHLYLPLAGEDSLRNGTPGEGKGWLSVALVICCVSLLICFLHDCLALEVIYCRLL